MQDLQTPLPVGTIVQWRYIVQAVLGKDGFGPVYLVKDQPITHNSSNLFVLKELINLSKQERYQITSQGKLLKELHHPALPRIHHIFSDDQHDRVYILMDYVEGVNLELLGLYQSARSFSLPQIISIIVPVIDSLIYLHSQQRIHQHIKPSNIIISKTTGKAILVNFNPLKKDDHDSSKGVLVSRPHSLGYGAPEQYRGEISTRTDIYGLGATLYTLVTGLVPTDALYRVRQWGDTGIDPLVPVNRIATSYSTSITETIYRSLHFHRMIQQGEKEPENIGLSNQITASIPAPVAEFIQRAMSIASNDRFATVEQFWEALRQASITTSSEQHTAEPSVTVLKEENTELSAKPPVQKEVEPLIATEKAPTSDADMTAQQIAETETAPSTEAASLARANVAIQGTAESIEHLPKLSVETEHPLTPDTNSTQQRTPEAALVPATPPGPPTVPQQEEAPVPVSLQEWPHVYQRANGEKRKDVKQFVGISRKRALAILVLLVLSLGSIGGGTSLWFYTTSQRHAPSTAPSSAHQSGRTSPSPTVSPHSTVTSTPVPATSPYPNIATRYTGTLHDISTGTTTNISLTHMQQQQGNISGYFGGMPTQSIFNGIPQNGPFTGSINTANQIQFTVMSDTGQAPFSFDGGIQSDGTIAGTYCNLGETTGKCSDYGIWSLSPAT